MTRRTIDKSGQHTNARAGANQTRLPDAVSAGELADVRGVRSEGQRRLLEIAKSLREVAAAVGCSSPQTVSDWRSGTKTPGPAMRAKLADALGIPEASWGQVPTGGESRRRPTAAAAKPVDDTAPDGSPTTMAGVLKLLDMARERMEDSGLLEAERAKWAAEFSRALALKARLEKEAELLEDRIVREHPMWKRLKRSIIRALVPFPAAAKAVAAALKELEI